MSGQGNFPNVPSFEDALLPAPPILRQGQEDKFLKDVESYLSQVFITFNDLDASIKNGWLVKDPRVISLSADKIAANTVFTQDLFVGNDKNIELLGTLDVIQVKDKQTPPKTRVKIGKLGVGSDQWGIQVTRADGTVVFQASDTTFLNGAVITDATITGGKIVDAAITTTKIADGAVTNAKVSSISATKITTGTLTVNSTAVAIDVTSGGAVTLRNGADIVMRASASGNTNFIVFQTSTGSDRGKIAYEPSIDDLVIYGLNPGVTGSNPRFRISKSTNYPNGRIDLGARFVALSDGGTGATIDLLGAKINSSLLPDSDNSWDVGSNTFRWRLIRGVTITSGDLVFENNFYITESETQQALEFYNEKQELIAVLDSDGNLALRGVVRKLLPSEYKVGRVPYKE